MHLLRTVVLILLLAASPLIADEACLLLAIDDFIADVDVCTAPPPPPPPPPPIGGIDPSTLSGLTQLFTPASALTLGVWTGNELVAPFDGIYLIENLAGGTDARQPQNGQQPTPQTHGWGSGSRGLINGSTNSEAGAWNSLWGEAPFVAGDGASIATAAKVDFIELDVPGSLSNNGLWGGGGFAAYLRSSGLLGIHFDTSPASYHETVIPGHDPAGDYWIILVLIYDGTTLSLSVNGGAWVDFAETAAPPSLHHMTLFRTAPGGDSLNGIIRWHVTSADPQDKTTMAGVSDWLRDEVLAATGEAAY